MKQSLLVLMCHNCSQHCADGREFFSHPPPSLSARKIHENGKLGSWKCEIGFEKGF